MPKFVFGVTLVTVNPAAVAIVSPPFGWLAAVRDVLIVAEA